MDLCQLRVGNIVRDNHHGLLIVRTVCITAKENYVVCAQANEKKSHPVLKEYSEQEVWAVRVSNAAVWKQQKRQPKITIYPSPELSLFYDIPHECYTLHIADRETKICFNYLHEIQNLYYALLGEELSIVL